MLHKEITQQVINAAKAVHNDLGAGLPHNFYRRALEIELRTEGLAAEVDKPVKLHYRGESLGELGVDFCVNSAIVVLLIDTPETSPDEYGKLRALLKALELEVGLLLNFNGARLDIRRVEAVPKKQAQTA
ncbi:MAG: GxxExxY protein [Planctomycetes bacterium]|nr:GxxExxY protein [Planctomycetota bacterium]